MSFRRYRPGLFGRKVGGFGFVVVPELRPEGAMFVGWGCGSVAVSVGYRGLSRRPGSGGTMVGIWMSASGRA